MGKTKLLFFGLTIFCLSCGKESKQVVLQDQVPYPEGYRSWVHVKSMELKEKHPLYKDFGGLHHVYVNELGLATLKNGGSYPDGTIFVFDLLSVKSTPEATEEGERKVLGVMYKNSKAFPNSGGWGFEGFQGNTQERLVNGKHEVCFNCHASQKATDYVFSKYRP